MTTITNGESGLSVRNKLNDIWAGLELNAIDTSIAATAVDVFVYDTSKDSDGGAWRKRTQHTSWYNETLNTSTRGSRREFPAVAVIVAESDTVTIYDGDDPSLPMWMVFPFIISSPTSVTSVAMLNGEIFVGSDISYSIGLTNYSFAADTGRVWFTSGNKPLLGSVADRPSDITEWSVVFAGSYSGSSLVNAAVNDVAMTVLHDAPIDPATGLPVPTIAVATDGGTSVIRDDGTVVDIATYEASSVSIDGEYVWAWRRTPGTSRGYLYRVESSIREMTDISFFGGSNGVVAYVPIGDSVETNEGPTKLLGTGDNTTWKVIASDSNIVAAQTSAAYGFNRIADDISTPSEGMVAYTTSTYNTGWLPGDIKGAFLSDTDDTDLVGSGELVTNGTFDTDVSGWTFEGTATDNSSAGYLDGTTGPSTNNLVYTTVSTVVGETYCATVDNTGASGAVAVLAGGSAFSSTRGISTYVSAGESATMTFVAASATTYISIRADAANTTVRIDNVSVKLADADRSVNNNGLIVNGTVTRTPVATGADLVAYSGFSASNYLSQPYNADLDFGTGDFAIIGWLKLAANTGNETILRRDSNPTAQRFSLAVNPSGFLVFACDDDTTVRAATSNRVVDNDVWTHFVALYDGAGDVKIYLDGVLDDTETGSALLTLNNASAVLRMGLAVDGAEPLTNGSLALLRISATVPSDSQIRRIYEDEKVLFQENAQATLYGASDAVTALAHDSELGLLHVGTSAGRSVFSGLRRVSNTTTAVGTAISASGGLVVEE